MDSKICDTVAALSDPQRESIASLLFSPEFHRNFEEEFENMAAVRSSIIPTAEPLFLETEIGKLLMTMVVDPVKRQIYVNCKAFDEISEGTFRTVLFHELIHLLRMRIPIEIPGETLSRPIRDLGAFSRFRNERHFLNSLGAVVTVAMHAYKDEKETRPIIGGVNVFGSFGAVPLVVRNESAQLCSISGDPRFIQIVPSFINLGIGSTGLPRFMHSQTLGGMGNTIFKYSKGECAPETGQGLPMVISETIHPNLGKHPELDDSLVGISSFTGTQFKVISGRTLQPTMAPLDAAQFSPNQPIAQVPIAIGSLNGVPLIAAVLQNGSLNVHDFTTRTIIATTVVPTPAPSVFYSIQFSQNSIVIVRGDTLTRVTMTGTTLSTETRPITRANHIVFAANVPSGRLGGERIMVTHNSPREFCTLDLDASALTECGPW